MRIIRDIYVTKNMLQAPIEFAEGTNSIEIEFNIRDYNIPNTSAAVVYSMSTSSMSEPNKALADIDGNKITICPNETFFAPGENVVQIRVIDGDHKLISFHIIVKCTRKIKFDDETEEQQSTLIEQILAKLGEYSFDLSNAATKDELNVEKQRIDVLDVIKANKTDVASPYNFKGSCLSTDLPKIDNEINDTYYCTDLKYRVTWNGSDFEQSSLDETAYEDELTKIDGNVSELKEDISELEKITTIIRDLNTVAGCYINVLTSPVDIFTFTSNNEWFSNVYSCLEGTIFKLIGTGGVSARMWTFLDNDFNIIEQADEMNDIYVSKEVVIVAPKNTAFAIFNFRNTVPHKAYIYALINDKNTISNYCNTDSNYINFKKDGLNIHGVFVDKNNGVLVKEDLYNVTKLIKVYPGEKISFQYTNMGAYYDILGRYICPLKDENGEDVIQTQLIEQYVDVPNDAYFVAFSIYDSRLDIAYMRRQKEYEYQQNTLTISKDGKGNFTTLRDGIAEAIKRKNCTVYVGKGVYDLVEEFDDEIQNAINTQYGIRLANNVHIIFCSGCKVKAIYNGDNGTVETYFAPFYADNVGNNSDFIIENLDIESKNTRYCIHDELGGMGGSYTHKYINCKMVQDNLTSTLGLTYFPQCIGGGLGEHGYIEIVGCYFKSKRGETEKTPLVSYHNGEYNNIKSNINVRDCYFDDLGTFRVSHFGNSTEVSTAIICNCSVGEEPYIIHEGGSTGPENMELLSYMNEIRTN